MRLLLVALLGAVAACTFSAPDGANGSNAVPPDSDRPPVTADAPAVTPADAAPPIDMPPPPPPDGPPNGQHCHLGFKLGEVNVSVDCDRNATGSSTCQCFREGTFVKTCTTFSLQACSLPTCCGDFGGE